MKWPSDILNEALLRLSNAAFEIVHRSNRTLTRCGLSSLGSPRDARVMSRVQYETLRPHIGPIIPPSVVAVSADGLRSDAEGHGLSYRRLGNCWILQFPMQDRTK